MGLYESIAPFLFIQSDTNGCIDAQRDSLRNFSFSVPRRIYLEAYQLDIWELFMIEQFRTGRLFNSVDIEYKTILR